MNNQAVKMYAEQDCRDATLFRCREVLALGLHERAERCSPASWPTSGWVVFSVKRRIKNFMSDGQLDPMRPGAVYQEKNENDQPDNSNTFIWSNLFRFDLFHSPDS